MTPTEEKVRAMLRTGTTPEAVSRQLGAMGSFYLRDLQKKRIVETVDGITRLYQYRADPVVVALYQRRKAEEQAARERAAVVEAEAARWREERKRLDGIDAEKRRKATDERIERDRAQTQYRAELARCRTPQERDKVALLSRLEAMAAKAMARFRPMGNDELRRIGITFGIEMDTAA